MLNNKNSAANLRLLQAADIVSRQFCSPDMIAVDLEFELHLVSSPDKSSVDSPPAKGATLWVIN
jgi:hypothetical protein